MSRSSDVSSLPTSVDNKREEATIFVCIVASAGRSSCSNEKRHFVTADSDRFCKF